MVGFLARAASNLTEVYFIHCKLWDGGSWRDLFKKLQARVSFPRLEEFVVDKESVLGYLAPIDQDNPESTVLGTIGSVETSDQSAAR